ncbi:hypothetical protein BC829DRAFT_195815 [Chytridium lagenaria]|nr:hypothetical protein BC829DRAFT_195815 [Chytridium lagenaria]
MPQVAPAVEPPAPVSAPMSPVLSSTAPEESTTSAKAQAEPAPTTKVSAPVPVTQDTAPAPAPIPTQPAASAPPAFPLASLFGGDPAAAAAAMAAAAAAFFQNPMAAAAAAAAAQAAGGTASHQHHQVMAAMPLQPLPVNPPTHPTACSYPIRCRCCCAAAGQAASANPATTGVSSLPHSHTTHPCHSLLTFWRNSASPHSFPPPPTRHLLRHPLHRCHHPKPLLPEPPNHILDHLFPIRCRLPIPLFPSRRTPTRSHHHHHRRCINMGEARVTRHAPTPTLRCGE